MLKSESHEVTQVVSIGTSSTGYQTIHQSNRGIRLDTSGGRVAVVETRFDNRRNRALDRTEHGDVTGDQQ